MNNIDPDQKIIRTLAKHIWGEESIEIDLGPEGAVYAPAWQAHLQAMVLSDRPDKYLKENT